MYPYIHSPCEYFDTNPTKKCLRFIPATSQKRGNCEESCLGEISKANTNLLIPLERPALEQVRLWKRDNWSIFGSVWDDFIIMIQMKTTQWAISEQNKKPDKLLWSQCSFSAFISELYQAYFEYFRKNRPFQELNMIPTNNYKFNFENFHFTLQKGLVAFSNSCSLPVKRECDVQFPSPFPKSLSRSPQPYHPIQSERANSWIMECEGFILPDWSPTDDPARQCQPKAGYGLVMMMMMLMIMFMYFDNNFLLKSGNKSKHWLVSCMQPTLARNSPQMVEILSLITQSLPQNFHNFVSH